MREQTPGEALWAALQDILMRALVIPTAYRLAGLLSRIQGWFRG